MEPNFLEIKFNKDQPSISTSRYPKRETIVFNTRTKSFNHTEESEYLMIVKDPETTKKDALRAYYEKVVILMKEQNPLVVIFDIQNLNNLVELKAIHTKLTMGDPLIHFDLGLFEINKFQYLQVFFCAKTNKYHYKKLINKKEQKNLLISLQEHMIRLWNQTNKKTIESMIDISSDALTEALAEIYSKEIKNGTSC